jgi:eukaryotic-like serine/threonine-protein kinase
VVVSEADNVSSRRVVGRYRTYEAIASGGMATVHFGRMLAPLGFARTVAVKRLHREYARDPEFVAMFMDEARLAARIHHPNVVQTLDVVASDGEIFLVMEYVPAASLAQLLLAAEGRAERAPAPVAVAILADVLQGLHAAHEATDEEGNPLDIVHRDVSPQNILVGADGSARVLDFGIAKATGRAAQVTREGQLKGKFAYMAPEQVTNVGVTRQSDIFAASIVLWEALTGRRLFQGQSEAAVLARVLSAPIEPPSKYAPELPPGLDAVVLRGLARDLSERYATAREMARDLEANGSPGSASHVGEWVERLAGDDLARRAVRVAEIESDSPGERVSVATALSTSIDRRRASELGAAGGPLAGRFLSRRGQYRAAALAAVALLGAAALAGRMLSARVPAAPRAEVHSTAPAPPITSSGLATAGPDHAEGFAPPAESASAESATAEARPAPSTGLKRPPRTAGVKPPPARSAPPPTACDPPYYADSKGHVVYKPECFQ